MAWIAGGWSQDVSSQWHQTEPNVRKESILTLSAEQSEAWGMTDLYTWWSHYAFNMRIHHCNHTGLYLTPFWRGAVWVWWDTSWGDVVAFSGREGINWLRYLGSSELETNVCRQAGKIGGCKPWGMIYWFLPARRIRHLFWISFKFWFALLLVSAV